MANAGPIFSEVIIEDEDENWNEGGQGSGSISNNVIQPF